MTPKFANFTIMPAPTLAIGTSQLSLLSLPPEVFYIVTDLIENPRDLYQLSLTSKSLHCFIISNNLHFRSIRCELFQVHIWTLFQTNLSIASRIQTLELIPHLGYKKPLVPSSCRTRMIEKPIVDEEDAVVHLKKAIANMINLVHLSWSNWYSSQSLNDELGRCLEYLSCCGSAEELRISDYYSALTLNSTLNRYRYHPMTDMKDLTRIDVSLGFYDWSMQYNTPNGDRFLDMIISQCPKLEELRMSFVNSLFFAPCIFVDGHWPKLRRLTLDGCITCFPTTADVTEKSAILNAFWSRHPNIEHLFLGLNEYYKLDIQSGSLPRLKSLSANLTPRFSAIAVDVLSHIEHLYDMTKALSTPRFPISFFKHATLLKSLIVSTLGGEWEQLVALHPNISRFACLRLCLTYPDTSSKYANARIQSIFKTLSGLPGLTHLYTYKMNFHDVTEGLSILSQFPSLKYVVGLNGHNTWCVLERDVEGRVIGWYIADTCLQQTLWGDWGCDFRMHTFIKD